MVIVGSLPQDFFADGLHVVDIAEEVDDVFRAGEQGLLLDWGGLFPGGNCRPQQLSSVAVSVPWPEEHPAELRDALGIAIDTWILTHDVLYRFDGIANGHGLSFLLVEGRREVLYCEHEIRACPELLDELHGCPHRIKRRDLQNTRVAKVDDALILVFLQQCLKHGAGLRAVFREDTRLRTLSARSRRVRAGWSNAK
jgi:hypothetical protein